MNEVYVIAGGEWLRNNLNAIAAFMGTRTWDSGEDVTQAEQPQQPVSPAINDKKSDSGVNVPAGGIEQELKMKPEEEMEQQLPPGISESGEVVDMAAYEAWQQENHPDIQQQMQRREEVNINVHRERGEDVEPGDDF